MNKSSVGERSESSVSLGSVRLCVCSRNDPSAGSPTDTLLRLLLPLSGKVHSTFARERVRRVHRTTQSVEATGGVYKGQGRNRREMLTRAY